MKSHRKIMFRQEPSSALERLEASLETRDDASWYAERIEHVGRILFGDLWRTDETRVSIEDLERS